MAKPGVRVAVTQGIPLTRFRVGEGTTISHHGKSYGPGDEVDLEGPTAWDLALEGYGTVVGEEEE